MPITIPCYQSHEIQTNPHNGHERRIVVTSTEEGATSDGYHTVNELYSHRNCLYLAFLKYHSDHFGGWRSKLHHDGHGWDGWFLVGTEIDGKQITYHLPESAWPLCNWLTTYEKAPVEWDGHTPNDVLNLLRYCLTGE